MHILVIKPSSFGDIVHLFPTLALLHEQYPDMTADFVVNPEFAPLLDYSPLPIKRKIIFERRKLAKFGTFIPEMFRLCREIRREKYDFAVDFQGLFRSGFLTGIARAKVKAGFADPREKSAEWFYRRKIAVSPGHAVEKYAMLARNLFDLKGTLRQTGLPENPAAAAALPELPEHYAIFLPGTRWESKRFPPEFFGKLAVELQKHFPGTAFIAAGSPPEREIAQAIGCGVINMAGKTSLSELFELLRKADFVVGNDSGPLHAAAALNRPVFGFYGPTDPELTGPWGEKCGTFAADCPCRGCLKRFCPDGSYLCWNLDAGAAASEIADKVEKMR